MRHPSDSEIYEQLSIVAVLVASQDGTSCVPCATFTAAFMSSSEHGLKNVIEAQFVLSEF